MKTATTKMLCRVLIVSMFAMPFQAARAGMIGTPQALGAATAQSDRAAVLGAMSRSDVAGQLQAQGVDLRAATERVASMTDQEVHALAGQLGLPWLENQGVRPKDAVDRAVAVDVHGPPRLGGRAAKDL